MSESVDVQHIEGPVDANGDPNFGFSDADVALIKAKLSEPKIFVNGRLRFRDEVGAAGSGVHFFVLFLPDSVSSHCQRRIPRIVPPPSWTS